MKILMSRKPSEQVLSVSVNKNWKHIELQDVFGLYLYGSNRMVWYYIYCIIILQRYHPYFILLSNVTLTPPHPPLTDTRGRQTHTQTRVYITATPSKCSPTNQQLLTSPTTNQRSLSTQLSTRWLRGAGLACQPLPGSQCSWTVNSFLTRSH